MGTITSSGAAWTSQVHSMLGRFEAWTERVQLIHEGGKNNPPKFYDLVDDQLVMRSDGSGSVVLEFMDRRVRTPSMPDIDRVSARIFDGRKFSIDFDNLTQLQNILANVTKLFDGRFTTDGGFEFNEE